MPLSEAPNGVGAAGASWVCGAITIAKHKLLDSCFCHFIASVGLCSLPCSVSTRQSSWLQRPADLCRHKPKMRSIKQERHDHDGLVFVGKEQQKKKKKKEREREEKKNMPKPGIEPGTFRSSV